MRLLCAADERADAGYAYYGAAGGRLLGEEGGGGLDGVEGAREVGSEGFGPEV